MVSCLFLDMHGREIICIALPVLIDCMMLMPTAVLYRRLSLHMLHSCCRSTTCTCCNL